MAWGKYVGIVQKWNEEINCVWNMYMKKDLKLERKDLNEKSSRKKNDQMQERLKENRAIVY